MQREVVTAIQMSSDDEMDEMTKAIQHERAIRSDKRRGDKQQRSSMGYANEQAFSTIATEGRDFNSVIDDIFTFHDNPQAIPHYTEIREAAKAFAKLIWRHSPPCKDAKQAIEYVRRAVMFANAANALDGRGI